MIRSPIRHTAACAVAVGVLGVPLAASADFVICKQTFATLASASGSATSKSLPLVGQATSAEMASCVDANRPPSPDRLAGIIPEIDIPSARALHADERCDEVLIFFRKHRGSIEKWLFCVHRKIEDPHLLAVNVEQCGNDPRLVRIRTCTNPDPTTKACPKPGLWESECIDAVGARILACQSERRRIDIEARNGPLRILQLERDAQGPGADPELEHAQRPAQLLVQTATLGVHGVDQMAGFRVGDIRPSIAAKAPTAKFQKSGHVGRRLAGRDSRKHRCPLRAVTRRRQIQQARVTHFNRAHAMPCSGRKRNASTVMSSACAWPRAKSCTLSIAVSTHTEAAAPSGMAASSRCRRSSP